MRDHAFGARPAVRDEARKAGFAAVCSASAAREHDEKIQDLDGVLRSIQHAAKRDYELDLK